MIYYYALAIGCRALTKKTLLSWETLLIIQPTSQKWPQKYRQSLATKQPPAFSESTGTRIKDWAIWLATLPDRWNHSYAIISIVVPSPRIDASWLSITKSSVVSSEHLRYRLVTKTNRSINTPWCGQTCALCSLPMSRLNTSLGIFHLAILISTKRMTHVRTCHIAYVRHGWIPWTLFDTSIIVWFQSAFTTDSPFCGITVFLV